MPIASSDIQLRQAGASGLGGAISSTEAPGFGTVLPADSEAGMVDYICEYVRNGDATLTLSGAKLWLSANTPSPSTVIEVGIGTSAVNGTEQAVANSRTAPVGVAFSLAANEASALLLGDLPPLGSRAVWYRRTVTAGAAALNQDTYTRNVAGESPDETEEPENPVTKVLNVWTGTPTSDGAVISAKMLAAGDTRVAVSTSSSLSNPVYSSIVAPDATYRVAKHVVSGLVPDTEYFYGIEQGGEIDNVLVGRFRTLPAAGVPFNFTIALGGCAENTNDAAFAAINAISPKPLFMLTMGDHQYMDVSNPSLAHYNNAFDITFARAERGRVAREMANVYMWDDHDIAGDNSAGRSSTGVANAWRANALTFYRARVPSVPASSVADDTVHYSFVVGRVRFVVSDLRSDRWFNSAPDNADKTTMGATQKAWWKSEISAAKAEGQAVAWVNNTPWVTGSSTSDSWGVYQTERRELSDHIKAEGMAGQVFILTADMHALAIHSGADYATGGGAPIPVFHAGPLNRLSSNKGGPYTQGPYPGAGSNVTQYGIMSVVDDGTDMTVTWTGYSADGTQRMQYSFAPMGQIVEPPAPTAPARMAAPIATAGIASATVQLLAPNNGGAPITGYTVVSNPPGGVDGRAGQTELFRTISELDPGTAYTFTATAVNSVGVSPVSPPSNAVMPTSSNPAPDGFDATGGVISEPGDGYRYWTFTSSGTMNVTSEGSAEYLVVAGGGAGSVANSSTAGGGGAGEPASGVATFPAGVYQITVGEGGLGVASGSGGAGKDSSIDTIVSAIGGGFGGRSNVPGRSGASGGGGSAGTVANAPGSGTDGKGHAGGAGYASSSQTQQAGGGGGGASSPGKTATSGAGGDGGDGVTIWGKRYAGGGGGSSQGSTQGKGVDGGGDGSASGAAGNAVPGTGSGGGGASNNMRSGDGARGIVIIRRAI